MKRNVDLQTFSETLTENSSPKKSIYLPCIKAEKSGHRKILRSRKKGNVIELLKQTTVIENERKEATKKCKATQTDMTENDKYDEELDYVYR